MSEQIKKIQELLAQVDREGQELKRQLDEVLEELVDLRRRKDLEIERLKEELVEREKELINSDHALEIALQTAKTYKDMLIQAGLMEVEVKLKTYSGRECDNCHDELIGSEVGKRYCNKCYRIWAMENGKWRSGTWRSWEERQKERMKIDLNKEN